MIPLRLIISCTVILSFVSMDCIAQEQPSENKAAPKKPVPEAWSFTADPQLPNVLILGDSISIGYTLQVRKLLAGKANVYRPLNGEGTQAENCAGTTKGVAQIDKWLGSTKWSVIHFNFGLHDMKHVKKPGTAENSQDPADPKQADLPQYEVNLEKIVEKISATNAKLIFATTTPVPEGYSKLRDITDPPLYNEVALKVMKSHSIEVNDLASLVAADLPKYQIPKDVHFRNEGSQALAERVADAIEKALQK